jgi:hypothetical protein
MASDPPCRWCTRGHPARFICPPAKRILDALYARGMDGNMPTIEFPAPIPAEQLGAQFGLGGDSRFLRSTVVQAGTVDAAGVMRPLLILTGIDTDDQPVPKYVYAGTDEEVTRFAKLVADMTDLAIRTAAKANEGRTP